MTHPDLDELVRQARRDGPALSLLSAVARRLHEPFVVAPLRAVAVQQAPAALNAEKRPVKDAVATWERDFILLHALSRSG